MSQACPLVAGTPRVGAVTPQSHPASVHQRRGPQVPKDERNDRRPHGRRAGARAGTGGVPRSLGSWAQDRVQPTRRRQGQDDHGAVSTDLVAGDNRFRVLRVSRAFEHKAEGTSHAEILGTPASAGPHRAPSGDGLRRLRGRRRHRSPAAKHGIVGAGRRPAPGDRDHDHEHGTRGQGTGPTCGGLRGAGEAGDCANSRAIGWWLRRGGGARRDRRLRPRSGRT